jgi:hypothetical protein
MYNSQWETKIKPILEDIGLLQVFSLRVKDIYIIYIYLFIEKKNSY